jgi:hypothetical protein
MLDLLISILRFFRLKIGRGFTLRISAILNNLRIGGYCYGTFWRAERTCHRMGYKNVEYHAYEIDKYAMKVANSNYPDIIQHGDAFQVRDDNWRV